MRRLTEREQARQDLILDAIREQRDYERTQQGKVVKAVKTTVKMLLIAAQVVAYIAVSILTYKHIISIH